METTPDPAALFMVEVRVRDLSQSVAWYCRALGLTVRLRDEPGRFALLEAGGAGVALKEADDPPRDRRAIRLTFRVADVDAERDRLLALGIPISEPIANAAEGYRELRLADPDGTPVSLFSWIDAED